MIYKLLVGALVLLGYFNAHAFELQIKFAGNVPEAAQEKIERVRDRVEVLASSAAFAEGALAYRNYTCFNSNNLPEGVTTVSEAVEFAQKARASITISFFDKPGSATRAVTGPNLISFNTYYFNTDPEKAVANTLFHETLHSLSFGHCGKNNIRFFPRIKRSAPYRFGDVIEALYDQPR